MAAYLSDDMDQQANNAQKAYDGYQNAKNFASKFGGHAGEAAGSAGASATAGSAGGAATGASTGATVGSTAGSAGGPVGSAAGAAVGVAVDQLKDSSGAASVATCSGAGCCCCGCGCTPLIALMLFVSILFTQLSPSYLWGNMYGQLIKNMNYKSEQAKLTELSDDISKIYYDAYVKAKNDCLAEIGGKTSAYWKAYLTKKQQTNAVKAKNTIAKSMNGKMTNGGAYSNDIYNVIHMNGHEISKANYEYIVLEPCAINSQDDIKDVIDIPYILAAYDYKLLETEPDTGNKNLIELALQKVGDFFGFSTRAKLSDQLLDELKSSINDEGLCGYQIVEQTYRKVGEETIDITYTYTYYQEKVSYSYEYRFKDTGKAVYAKKENNKIILVDKSVKGAKKLLAFESDKNFNAFLTEYNERCKKSFSEHVIERKQVSTTTKVEKEETVNGIYYIGSVYFNDLYTKLETIYNFDSSSEEGKIKIDEIGYKAGLYAAYAEEELGTIYLNGDVSAIMTCGGSQMPEYFATGEKNNYGLVAWAKMANTYDSTTQEEYGMDSPARWGYVWGHRGTKFTSSGYASVYNVSDGHYKDNPAAYAEIAKWVGHRVSDCNGLCVGYVDCVLNESGKIVIDSTLPYSVGETVKVMENGPYSITKGGTSSSYKLIDASMVGTVLMIRRKDGSYQHIGIYCGFNSNTNCYEVIHASSESAGVIKSSYKSKYSSDAKVTNEERSKELQSLLAATSWNEWAYMPKVTYYEAGTSEAITAESMASVAISSMVK